MAEQPTPNPAPRPAPALAATLDAAGRRPAARPAERRSIGRRSAALVRRWARDTFNRESFVSSFRSLLWVAPLTLLIWIYAEREQQLTDTARFQIVVKSADPTQVASFLSASDQNVMANLKGPKARLGKAKEMLDPRSGVGPVQIVIDGNRTANQYEIDILAQIQKDFRLADNGITVLDCNPRNVRIDVDRLEERELVVKADPQVRFSAPPTFDPPTVKITAPSSAIRGKGDVYAKANLPTLAPGPHALKAVPVTVEGLGDAKVTVRPGSVSASVDVGLADISYDIPSLPAFPIFKIDPQMLQNYTLRYEQSQFLSNVRVYGPPEKIDQFKNFALTPEAHFKVTDADVGKKVTRELQYELPEGVHPADTAPKTITFELVRKDNS